MSHNKSLDPISNVVILFEYSTKQKLQGAEELNKKKEQWIKDVNRKGGETSRQLMLADIPVPDAVVENFLNRGEMMILAGSPKSGKSVITTQMAIAVASGGKFLGEFQAERGAVLWYDADDGDRYRAQQRLEDLGHQVENENIAIFRSLKPISDGGVAQIADDLAVATSTEQRVALVLIDCLLAILSSGTSRSVVQHQRQQLEELRGLAMEHKFALVITHHSPKRAPKKAQGFSVFDAMLGTTGIGTVADVGVVLEDTGRAGETVAHFSGRNPDTPTQLTLRLDRAGRTGWHVTDGAEQARKSRELGIVAKAIIGVLENAATRLTPTEIVAAAERSGTALNFSSVKGNCRRMVQRGLLTEYEGGRYGIPETAVTAETVDASACETDTSAGYSYTRLQQPRAGTATAGATLEMVRALCPSPSAGTDVWSMPLATVPPALQSSFSTQKQAPEPTAKATPGAAGLQMAPDVAPAVKTPKAPSAAKKDKWILRALSGLGGTASAKEVAAFLKVTDSSRASAIMIHMVGMLDRHILLHENTPTVTVYSKATVGQTALDLAVDVEAPAEPAAAPEEATAPDAVANQDLAELDAKIIDCMAQGKSGYIPIAQTIGTTRDTVEHRMKAMLADGRLVNRRDADDCMMPGLPLSPAPVMPEGLTMEDQILWAVTGGHRRCGLISAAIGADTFEVYRMLKTMRDGYILDSLVVGRCVDHYLPGSKPTALAQAPAKTSPHAKTPDPSGILPGESCQAYQRRKAFEAAEAAKPSRFSQYSQAN